MRPHQLKYRLLIAAALTATVGLSTACSSSTGTSSGSPAGAGNGTSASKGVAQAKSAVQTAEQPSTFKNPGPAFQPSGVKGKTLWIIDVLSSIPLTQVTDAAAKQALGLLGAKVVRFDGQGSASDFARGVNQAIAAHASAIALFAIDPNVVAGPVQNAVKAGIPVIVLQYGDPGASLPVGVKAQVTYCYSCAGGLMADSIVTQTQGQGADIELITSTDVTNSKPLIQGFTQQLNAGCPACKIHTDNVPVANWQTGIGTTVQSALTADPNIRFVVPIYDGMALFAVPAIETSGHAKNVKVVTFNGTLGNMQDLSAGKIVSGEVGSPQAQEGWGLADQFLRLMSGKPAVQDENVSLRLFGASNIGSIDLSKPEQDWYGVDFQSGYKKLWGVG